MYMTLEGIYGTAVDVSATLIILFTIFGAFLQFTGAGKFFIDFSFAAMAWFFSPLALVLATALVALILYSREFRSDVLHVLRD